MRPHGRARISSRNPQAFAICDRCGFQYNNVDLSWQEQYAGNNVVNTGMLVCDTCLDDLNPQFLTPVVGPDPVPIPNPRPRRE